MSQTPAPARTLPRHVAVIMDGNGRWALKKRMERLEGHRAGLKNIPEAIKTLTEMGVPFVTLFSFSTENWKRPPEEVNGLLQLLAEALDQTAKQLDDHNVIVRHLGNLERLPARLKHGIKKLEDKTRTNTGTTASFAFDYGSRAEITEAVRKALSDRVKPASLDEKTFEKLLNTAGLPDVDLLIRTGGEKRLSNFLLWQSAYAELYFIDTLWPDFDRSEIEKALDDYAGRQRRFGGL